MQLLRPFCLLLFPLMMNATVVFDSFGAGTTYNTGFLAPLYNDIEVQQFSPLFSGSLSSITFALGSSNISTPPNLTNVFIYADAGGKPGAILEKITFDIGAFNNPAFNPGGLIVTAYSATLPFLSSSQSYWLGAAAVDPVNNPIGWYFGYSALQPGKLAEVFFNGAWVQVNPQPQTALAARINVTQPAPEPGVFALTAMGLLSAGLLGRRLRRRNGFAS